MAAWVAELPVRIHYGREVTGFAQDDTGVDVQLSDGGSLRARYLVGCDGGRSLIRRAAGIEFPGWDATRSNLIAEVETTEEPPKGVRHDAAGVHGLHRLEDGKTVRVVDDRAAARAEHRAHPARSERGAHRRVRHRLRGPQPDVDLQVHRHDPAGRGLPRRARPAGRRRGARALPGGWTGPRPRRAGRGEPGMEARAGGRRDLPGGPAGHLPGRASPGHRTRAPVHDGPDRAPAPRRSHQGRGRRGVGAGEPGRASQAARRAHLRAGHPLRARRGASAARAPHAGPRPRDRRRPAPRLRAAARARAGAARPRRARRLRHRAVGRAGAADRRALRGGVGAPGARRGQRPGRRARPPGRLRRLGRGRNRLRASRRR